MRLRNAAGVVVDVSDGTARRLGAGWEPADPPTPEPKAPPVKPPPAAAKPPAK